MSYEIGPQPPDGDSSGATCETQGHIYGAAGVCVFCESPKSLSPVEPPHLSDLLVEAAEWIEAHGDTTHQTPWLVLRDAVYQASRIASHPPAVSGEWRLVERLVFQRVEKRDGDFEAVLAAVDAERNDWRDEVAQRDETIRQQAEQIEKLEAENLQQDEQIAAYLNRDGLAACGHYAVFTQQCTYEDGTTRPTCMQCDRDKAQTDTEAAEARCATLQGAVAADEERLRQAAARAGVLFVGCDTADALADRCATLTAALEPFAAAWPSMRDAGATTALLRDYEAAHRAISGVPTP